MKSKLFILIISLTTLGVVFSCAKEDNYGPGEKLQGDFTSGNFGGGRLTNNNEKTASDDIDEKIVVTHEMKKEFVCRVKGLAKKINDSNDKRRDKVRGILQGVENQNATPQELLYLTETLIIARMMVPWIKRDFYFAPSRYTRDTIIRKTKQAALKFMESNPNGPKKCHYTKRVKEDGEWIARWNTYPITSEQCQTQLNKHLESIPVGQVMVQAAEESSWGTSKLARTIENYFGLQYKFDTIAELKRRKLCKQAGKAPRRCLFIFSGLDESIWEFYRTLNAGPYQSFYREYISEEIESIKTCLDAERGFEGLTNYAENADYRTNLRKHLPEVCEMAKHCD
jgi:hypothetical protein